MFKPEKVNLDVKDLKYEFINGKLQERKSFDANGHDYVEIAGIKWATMNVGAKSITDTGLYFQWGDTQGYTAEQVGKDKQFNQADYKWSIDGSSTNFRKYKTPGATLELADDAANANMGGSWHMPTPTQIKELINSANTISTWTTQDGVYGRLFTSRKDGSKSIFIPAAGGAWDGSIHFGGGYGLVWSSMLFAGFVSNGQGLYFGSGDAGLGSGIYRCNGCPVRGVLAEN